MCLQVVYAHIPSHPNSMLEEYDYHVQEWGSLLRGARRHRLLVGVDANVQIDNRYPNANMVGGAISRASIPQASERDNVGSLLAQAHAHGLRFMNTFENFYRAEDQRHTWEGPVFGHRSIRTIDYSLADHTTAQRLSSSLVRRTCRTPATMQFWDYLCKETNRMVALGPGPVRQDLSPLLAAAHDHDREHRHDHLDRCAGLPGDNGAAPTSPRPQPHGGFVARTVAMCASLSGRKGRSRAVALGRAPHHRGREGRVSFCLGHLRGDGWGARHLSHSHAPMPFMKKPDGSNVVAPSAIAVEASPAEEFRPQGVALSEELKVGQALESTIEATFSTEVIREARRSMKRYKACGEDGGIPEMVFATEEADWHWAPVFNQRIANLEGDPTTVITDAVWDHFRVRLLSKYNAPTAAKLLRPISIQKHQRSCGRGAAS